MIPKTIRTMEEFARSVGLSRPTVSKYFQDPASVRARVREKIEAGVAATGFRPNLFAVNLNRRRSRIIGLIFPNSMDPFYMGLRRRIEGEATAAGYLPFVFSSDGRADLEAEAIETLTSLNVAGVIMTPVGGAPAHRAKLKALAARLPIVFVDVPFDGEETFVGTNTVQGISLMTDYLTRLGDSPCFFAPPAVNTSNGDRALAYGAMMRRRGLQPVMVPAAASESWDFERYAFDQTVQVLKNGGFPTRIVLCANDRLAFGVLSAVQQAGMRVGIGPDCDLRIAGHDDHPLAEFMWPPLTTVSQNTAEIGRRAVELLLTKLGEDRPEHRAEHRQDPESRSAGRHVLLDADLVLRASA